MNAAGGNDWFWAPDVSGLMRVTTWSTRHLKLEPKWTNFLLNCPPNRDGLLARDRPRLGEVGAAWAPDTNRPMLPAQPPQIDIPYDPAGSTSTSGQSHFAIDGLDDFYTYTVWESAGPLPQSMTVTSATFARTSRC